MPSAYIPHQLIHAHLPPPPLSPNAIPELRVPTQRAFPSTSEILNEPIHPDHAVSVAHERTTGVLARSIENGYTLELRTLSLVIGQRKAKSGSESLRICFPDPLRPLGEGCIVHSSRTGRLYILVVTQANVLYRLTFPSSFREDAADRMVFTTKGNDEWCEEWAVPDDVVSACGGVGAWTVIDESNVVLGGGDGGIVRLVRSGRSECSL